MKKECSKCHIKKPLSEFHKCNTNADGLKSSCKQCRKSHRKANAERYRERDRRYNNANKEQRAATKLKLRRDNVEYYRAKDRAVSGTLKDKARRALRYAVKTGKIKRGPCRYCGDLKTQGHHSDYSKPLDVEWVCQKCHLNHYHSTS